MVIFKRKNRMLDIFWDTLPGDLKQEFERDYSAWNSFSGDRERIIAMNLFISELKEREYQKFFEDDFRRVVDHYDSLMKGFREEIGGAVRNVEGRVINIEERVTQIKAAAQDSLNTRMLEANNHLVPEARPEPTRVFTPVTTTGPCQYDKDRGPQDCMRYVERVNGTYASCTVADKIRRKQILPNFLTSVFEKTGCPSDWYITRCNYLDNKEIKIS